MVTVVFDSRQLDNGFTCTEWRGCYLHLGLVDRRGVLSDKLDKKGRLLTKSVNFLPAEEIDANVKFEVSTYFIQP